MASAAQVSLKCESKAEGEVWVEKLKQTALWFNDRQRKASGVRSGAGQSKAAPPRSDDPIRLAPTQSSVCGWAGACARASRSPPPARTHLPFSASLFRPLSLQCARARLQYTNTCTQLNAATKNTAGKDQCGVGMVLKQTAEGLLVKKLVDGAPAALSGSIELGDILLKVSNRLALLPRRAPVLEAGILTCYLDVSLVSPYAAAESGNMHAHASGGHEKSGYCGGGGKGYIG